MNKDYNYLRSPKYNYCHKLLLHATFEFYHRILFNDRKNPI